MIVKSIEFERRYESYGYIFRRVIVDDSKYGGDGNLRMVMCYSLNGIYLGDSREACFLCRKKGIRKFEKRSTASCGASIGFNPEENKWYGWSHRAIGSFGIGHETKEGDLGTGSGWTQEYLDENPEADESVPVGFEAKTLDDAKRMAIAFAASV